MIVMVLTIFLVVVWVMDLCFTYMIYRDLKALRKVEEWMVGKGDDFP